MSPFGATRRVRGCLNPLANTCTAKPSGTFGSAPCGGWTTFAGWPTDFSGSVPVGGAGRSDGLIWRRTPGAALGQPPNAAVPTRGSPDWENAGDARQIDGTHNASIHLRMRASYLCFAQCPIIRALDSSSKISQRLRSKLIVTNLAAARSTWCRPRDAVLSPASFARSDEPETYRGPAKQCDFGNWIEALDTARAQIESVAPRIPRCAGERVIRTSRTITATLVRAMSA